MFTRKSFEGSFGKFLASLTMAVTILAGLAIAVPAFAATNGPSVPGGMGWGGQNGSQNPGGPMMQANMPGRGNFGGGIAGSVTAVNGTTLTVTSKGFGQNTTTTTYTVNASNATVTKNNAASSVSSIAVGDNVFVQGTTSGTNVTATKIIDGQFRGGMTGGRMGPGMGGARPAVIGQVTSVSGTTLTVSGHSFTAGAGQNTATTTFTVDASNATVVKAGATSTVSSISVGDNVAIVGTVSGTSVTATSIRDGVGMGMMGGRGMGGSPGQGGTGAVMPAIIQGNGQPVIAGTVSTISGSTFSVTNNGSATYTVDASSATVVKGNATSTVSSISTGDHVVVQGAVNGTSVTASSVIDQGSQTGTGTSGHGPVGGFLGSIGSFFQHLFGF